MTAPYMKIPVGSVTGVHKKLMYIAADDVAELVATVDIPARPDEMLYSFVKSTTGSINLAEQSTGTTAAPIPYSYTVPVDKIALIRRCNMTAMDGAITPSKFVGTTALTKGLTVEALSTGSTQMIDFTDGHNIKANADWGFLAGVDVNYKIVAGDDGLSVRWTLGKSGGMLYLTSGESLTFKVQENFTDVPDINIMVQGLELSSVT